MTVESQPVPQTPTPSEGRLRSSEIDLSCRWPVLFLLGAAAAWLAFGGVLGFLTAIKAHGPGFLPNQSWLTYGRVRPAGSNALVYGFLLQAGLGIGLWMICRLGRTVLQGGWMIAVATALWNLGVAVGVVTVFAGGSTGYEWLEMSGITWPMLFVAYVLIAAWAVVNLHHRVERSLYVSQWFLLLGLFWFPWIYSTAQLLLVNATVRGVVQAVVNDWYIHNLFELCLGSFGLAAIFYFLPKLTGRALHSRGMALFAFWTLVFFGGWGGVRAGEPVPNWLTGVSVVARVFLLLPVVAIAMSWYGTWKGPRPGKTSDPLLRFVVVGAISYVLAAVLETLGMHSALRQITAFTVYDQGVAQLKLHGFLSLTLCGAAYYIIPRVSGCSWPWPRLVNVHFWCATVGVVCSVVGLVVGGVIQGVQINHAQSEFMQVVRSLIPFLGVNTLGATLLCIGYLLFGVQVARMLTMCCPCSTRDRAAQPVTMRNAVTGRSPA